MLSACRDSNLPTNEETPVQTIPVETPKLTPNISVTNIVPTQESVSFEFDITDTDKTGAITAIKLYLGDTFVESLTDLALRTFEGLFSNNTYEIKVIYTYDLNDGEGNQTIITSSTSKTLAKETPK